MTREEMGKGIEMNQWKVLKLQVNKFRYFVAVGHHQTYQIE